MRRVLSWAGTAVFLPTFVAILLVFDVAQRIARLFGQRPQEYVAGALQVALVAAFRLCGARLAIERAPGVRRRTSYVIVSNHQSMFDIPLFAALFFSNFPKYISKRSLGAGSPACPTTSGGVGTCSSTGATVRRRSPPSASSGGACGQVRHRR